jgi:hypothetical protein
MTLYPYSEETPESFDEIVKDIKAKMKRWKCWKVDFQVVAKVYPNKNGETEEERKGGSLFF